MTWVVVYAIAVLADLWTTDRGLRWYPHSVETGGLMSRLFGERPSRTQFAVVASVQAAFWGGLVVLGGMPEVLLLAPAAWHGWAATRNYRAIQKWRGTGYQR